MNFASFYDKLNARQRQAVDAVEGPVLVVAGPGTGKTQLLAARVGKILLETDAQPHNILCLTFTDAGAHAMRQRLVSLIGPQEAYRVPVFTFHSFCNRVIQDNPEHFGGRLKELLSDLERIEIIRKLLTELPTDHPLRSGYKNVFTFEGHLGNLFANMKKENWTPGLVQRKCREYLAEIPNDPNFIYQKNSPYGKKGEPKHSKVAEVTDKMNRLSAAADLYPVYQNELERASRYEYEDLIQWVLRGFETHENLLRNYQERYLYFLIDEYQDTNGAQNQLITQLIQYWEVPNIFIVGDDDQSIYEFQGARLKNLLEFYHRYQDNLELVVLEENYRSNQPILDAARRLVENNHLRALSALNLGEHKSLIAQPAAAGTSPEVWIYPTRKQEIADLADRIEALYRSGTTPESIAVLYRQHKQAEVLLRLLEKKGVPYQTRRPINVLEIPVIEQMRELLHYLNDELQKPFSGEHRLFRLMHAAFFNIPPLELATAFGMRNAEFGMRNWASQQNGEFPHLSRVMQLLETWISDAANLPLPALVEKTYNQSGMLAQALAQPDRMLQLEVLSSFLAFVQSECERQPKLKLARLLDLLQSMDHNRLRIALKQDLRDVRGVQLLTAHAAKGLEFDYVFMPDCTATQWESKRGGNQSNFSLPEPLTFSGEEDALEAARRLFYVAMTRARKHLVLSYSARGDDGKDLMPSQFIGETGLEAKTVQADETSRQNSALILLTMSEQPVITLPEDHVIDTLLGRFVMNPTSLNRFLRCPLAFYYEDLLRIPTTPSEYAAYGQAIHGVLQQFFLKKAPKGQYFPDAEVLVKLFKAEMQRRRALFSTAAYEQRLHLGTEHLRQYHEQQLPYWRRRAVVERRIDRVEIHGVPINGVIDKIEWLDGGTLRLTDYKTGKPDNKKIQPPSETQPYGGDYWRQLAFYQILMKNAKMFIETVSENTIGWLEPDAKGRFQVGKITYRSTDIEQVEQWIVETFQRIKNRDFTRGCGQKDCVWCAMHQKNQTYAASWSNADDEALDDQS